MIQDNILLILSLLFTTSMLALLSDRINISYPILLVLAGLVISIIPGIPIINLDPNIVFVIFMPPLLYSAAWNTSWSEFWRLRRPISLLAFGLVICTATAVAFFSHWLIPNFSLSLGFLLGGIISPPDAVAAAAVFEKLKVPRRVVAILEGESLVNDASSLIVFRFALIAVLTGKFAISKACESFFLVVFFGVLIGLGIGYIVYVIHKYLPTTSGVDIALTLISPYLMYLTAEHFHFSGVLAVVSGGLFLSFRSSEIFSYDSRLESVTVWNVISFLLNGIVFILIGLQLQRVIHSIDNYSLSNCIWFGITISLLAISVRLIWVFPAAYLPRILSGKIVEREGKLSWKAVFVTGWSGMRGVMSLASALAIPLTLTDGQQFPQRNLILFITFVVILFTLVIQGLSLPLLLRLMNEEVEENDEELEIQARLRLSHAALEYLNDHCSDELSGNLLFRRLRQRYERISNVAEKQLSGEEKEPEYLKVYQKMLISLIKVRRDELKKMHHHQEFPEPIIRAKERELDLEEARIRTHL